MFLHTLFCHHLSLSLKINFRFQSSAVMALQEVTETYLVSLCVCTCFLAVSAPVFSFVPVPAPSSTPIPCMPPCCASPLDGHPLGGAPPTPLKIPSHLKSLHVPRLPPRDHAATSANLRTGSGPSRAEPTGPRDPCPTGDDDEGED